MLYEKVASTITSQIEQGIYHPGDRIPGVRKLAKQFSVSVSTILEAHQLLEDQGKIEARPRSGYYVRTRLWQPPEQPAMSNPDATPTLVSGQALALELVKATNNPGIVPLGAAVPSTVFLPTAAVNRAIASAARQYGDRASIYEFPPGNEQLRRQIAKRLADAGCQVSPDEIVITSGCQEALALCLRAVAQPGDIIALESPTFYGLLQVIESLGMKALEIPTHPVNGISIEALELAIEQWDIRACTLVPNFSNPLGYCMSDENKKRLVALLSKHDITLIEDDVYGDLGFQQDRPIVAKAYDSANRNMLCSSFSKSLAPGPRVGWIVPGCYQEKVEYLKYVTNLATATVSQLAIADFLKRGGYDRYLRQVCSRYERQVEMFIRAVDKYFPSGTRVSQPQGGFVIWVECPEQVDAMQLYKQAMLKNISIAPGPIFSASQKYTNFIRINCAVVWDDRTDRALLTLGKLASVCLRE